MLLDRQHMFLERKIPLISTLLAIGSLSIHTAVYDVNIESHISLMIFLWNTAEKTYVGVLLCCGHLSSTWGFSYTDTT